LCGKISKQVLTKKLARDKTLEAFGRANGSTKGVLVTTEDVARISKEWRKAVKTLKREKLEREVERRG